MQKQQHLFYFTIDRDEFQPEQLKYMLSFEQSVGYELLATEADGLKVDFNSGARVQVTGSGWHVRISDYDSGLVGFDDEVADCTLVAAEKYYIRWQVEVWRYGQPVFGHVLDLAGQKVFIFMAGSALGDSVSLFPYLRLMREQYGCRIAVLPPDDGYIDLLRAYFPDMEVVREKPVDAYASYCLAVFQKPPYLIASDSRTFTPALAARSVLGLHREAVKVIYRPTGPRQIKERYVCIAVQASGIMKRWLASKGWDMIVAYLKGLGYRVLCIDGSAREEADGYVVEKPSGAEDFTGLLPLMDRINLLAYADFFIGLGSGLSWLADACDVPVVLISGFSLPLGEFDTPYRVTNQLVCHGCYNDIRVDWKTGCPYHAGTDREFECSKAISFRMVRNAIDRLIREQVGSDG